MKLKIRGADDFLNYALEDKDFEILVGYDSGGNEVYTGDIIFDDEGNEFKVGLSLELNYLSKMQNLSNFRLKETKKNADDLSRSDAEN